MKQKASLLAFLVLTVSAQLQAANVTLTATNGAGTTSFATGTSWSDVTAPSAANDYFVTDARALRTEADSGSATFAGNSLTLGNSTTAGILIFKNQASGAIVTVNNLTLNNGEIQNGGTSSGAASVVTFAGNGITLAGTTSNRINSGAVLRGIIINAPISGTGSLVVSGGGTVTLTGANSYGGTTTFTGTGTRLQFANTAAMSASSAITVATGNTLAVNVGGAGEFTGTGTGAGSIAGLLAGTGGQGSAVTLSAGSSLGIDTTNATGNVTLGTAFTSTNNAGLLKLGTGTLELTNGGTYASNGAGGFPLIVRQGTLLLNGGTHTVTGEAVVGGNYNTAAAAAGFDAKLQVDAGTLAVSGFLSVGRGNGIGGVSSDLEINNSAIVTAANLSAGYNGVAGNLPKGKITLNNSASLSIANNGVFRIGESTGSHMTATLNGSSTVSVPGTGIKRIGEAGSTGILNINGTSTATFGGTIAVGWGNNSSGTATIDGGTLNTNVLQIGAKNSAVTDLSNGTVTVSNNGKINSEGDLIIGQGGAGSGKLILNSGAAVTVASTTERWLIINNNDASAGELTINGGSLTLNANTDIRFSTQSTSSGTNILNLNSGTITGGVSSVLDLKNSTNVNANNTVNLNGGTLTISQITSSSNTGTRTLNLNGGTIKATVDGTLVTANAASRVNVRNGGATIDSNGFNITVAQALEHSNVGGDNATDGGLTKSGTGILTLTAASTYTGATVVSAGTLLVNGSLGNTAVTVQSGATLGGTGGTIGTGSASVSVSSGGTLAPGSSIGALAVNGSVTVGGTYAFEYDGGTVNGDVLDVNGTLTLNNATLSLTDFGGDSYTLGDKFTLAAYDTLAPGSVFSGYADDSLYSFNGGSWLLNYDDTTAGLNGGVGNAYITITAIPEPAAMLLGSLGLLGLLRRRRIS